MMYCPALTAFYGTGNAGELPSSSKLSGFFMRQTDDVTQDIALVPNFWTTTRGGQTMSQFYGS